MTGAYLKRIRTAWGSKRRLAAVLQCARSTITRNERKKYISRWMEKRLNSRRGYLARRHSRGWWRADKTING